jgi:lysophospholipase L1-like esterase
VLAQPGATRAIVLIGINDLGLGGSFFPPPVSAEQLIAGYKQIIARAQAEGLEILLGTVMPCKGFPLPGYCTPDVEVERQAVNEWIRTTDLHDGFVDFDAALRDPDDPARLFPPFDSGDNLHPSDAGYARMAEEAEKALIAPAKGRGPRR